MGENNSADDKDIDTTDTGADDQDDGKTEDEADTSKNSDADDADAGDTDDTDGGDSDDQDDAEDDSDDDGKGSSDKKSSDTAKDDDADDKGDEDDGAEPELRKPKAGASNAEWAAWRKQQKDKAAKAAQSKKSKDTGSDEDDASDEDTDEDLSPEDAAAIDKRIAKHLEPFKKQAAEQEVEAEIATFLQSNPDFKPFAAKAKRWAMHPSRANVPVKSIFYEIAGDKLIAIGAKRRAEADAKARKTKGAGGSNAGNDGGSKSYKDMPLDDFGKELDAIKAGARR